MMAMANRDRKVKGKEPGAVNSSTYRGLEPDGMRAAGLTNARQGGG